MYIYEFRKEGNFKVGFSEKDGETKLTRNKVKVVSISDDRSREGSYVCLSLYIVSECSFSLVRDVGDEGAGTFRYEVRNVFYRM